jgi:hypothetical protein
MTEPTRPTRADADFAEMVEMLLDKGVVINADITVSVGDTEMLGIQLRAAVASFDTAAEYGLQFPSGTDMQRVRQAAGVDGELTAEGRHADGRPEIIDTTGREVESEDGSDEESVDGPTAEDTEGE